MRKKILGIQEEMERERDRAQMPARIGLECHYHYRHPMDTARGRDKKIEISLLQGN